ncbi:hypothetical protein BASA81_002201 [Batrachochytrium salamandrivorans]|nr:hypothetical protein BASA81_002201 [Batrachochytrium salamandrivorans]
MRATGSTKPVEAGSTKPVEAGSMKPVETGSTKPVVLGMKSLRLVESPGNSVVRWELVEYGLTEDNVQAIASAIQHENNRVQALHLDYNKISDLGCQYLANALMHENNHVQVLDLEGNQITLEGAKLLQHALASVHCKLHTLNLIKNPCSKDGGDSDGVLEAIAKALRRDPDLEEEKRADLVTPDPEATLEQTLGHLRRTNSELEDQLNLAEEQFHNRLEQANRDSVEMERMLRDYNAGEQAYKQAIVELEERLGVAEEIVGTSNEANIELEERVRAVESLLKLSRARNIDLEEQLKDSEEQLKEQTQANTDLEKRLLLAEMQHKDALTEATHLAEDRFLVLEQKLREELETSEMSVSNLEQQLQTAHRLVAKAQSHDVGVKLEQAQAQLADAQQELVAAQQDFSDRLLSSNQQLEAMFQEQIRAGDLVIVDLESRLASLMGEKDAIIVGLDKRVEVVERELHQALTDNRALNSKLAQADKLVTDKHALVVELSQRCMLAEAVLEGSAIENQGLQQTAGDRIG